MLISLNTEFSPLGVRQMSNPPLLITLLLNNGLIRLPN